MITQESLNKLRDKEAVDILSAKQEKLLQLMLRLRPAAKATGGDTPTGVPPSPMTPMSPLAPLAPLGPLTPLTPLSPPSS